MKILLFYEQILFIIKFIKYIRKKILKQFINNIYKNFKYSNSAIHIYIYIRILNAITVLYICYIEYYIKLDRRIKS